MMIFKVFKIVVLIIWSLFLAWLITFGRNDLARLLHPRLWWLVVCGSVVFFIFFLRQVVSFKNSFSNPDLALQLPSLLILLLPILFFYRGSDVRFNVDTFRTRTVQTTDGSYLNSMSKQVEETEEPAEKGDDTLESLANEDLAEGVAESKEVQLTQLYRQYDEYLGKEVEVVCQTFVDKELPENIAMCYRYLIACCAADAQPLFIFLHYPESLTIENDKWIRTRGKVSVFAKNNANMPELQIEQVTYVEEPAFPYVF
jgi:putative membrane protein